MAQLKDTVVQGTLSATDALISTSVQTSILRAPSSSNSTTYGPGTNGQILRSNGTKAYWGTLAATDIPDVYIKKAGNNDGIMTGTLTLHGLKGTADIDYGTTLPTSPTTGQIFFQISDPWYELPPVNSSDNGKILTVVSGQWTAVTKQNELPSVSSSDNGKVLSVVNGVWASSNSLTTLSNNLGDLSSLTTTAKTSAVAAINEVKAGVDTNSDAIANMKLVYFTALNLTIPDGRTNLQTIDVDFSSVVPSGKTLVGNTVVKLGNYNLPYRSTNGVMNTWVESVSDVTKKIRIHSNATEWTNYTLRVILFFN